MEEAIRFFRTTREYLTPVMKDSAFLEKGMLTPEEFVQAGDRLVKAYPSWRWESGDPTKVKPYLPADKQYLLTTGVPSYQRVSSLSKASLIQKDINVEGSSESWLETELKPAGDNDDDIDFIDKDEINEGGPSKEEPIPQSKSNKDEYLDMEDESLALDEMTISPNTDKDETNSFLKGRKYDVSITYDNYYRTPRVWLFGYDENGSPLDPTAVFEDIMQDYAKRTVTIDPHPHLNFAHASIHPCQHGPAMLKIIQAIQESGNTPTVDQYIFIFLKFIQSVIPTIEYDYTQDVQVMSK